MTVDTTIRRWHAPSGADAHTQKLSQALNQIEGLHSAVVSHDVTLASQDRWLILGPQTTPVGITVVVRPGAVMTTL